MTHLSTLTRKLWQKKKDRKSNCQFDSQPLKVRIVPNFPMWSWRATHRWKTFNEGYNFASNFALIKGLHIKLWAPKVVGVSISGISGLSLGNPETK